MELAVNVHLGHFCIERFVSTVMCVCRVVPTCRMDITFCRDTLRKTFMHRRLNAYNKCLPAPLLLVTFQQIDAPFKEESNADQNVILSKKSA